jgi:peptide/nickel transport system substrate-binding protein
MRLARRTFLASVLTAPSLWALGRKPYGGTLRLALPFTMDAIDPHAADDVAGALLAPAIADPLYAWDGAGRPYAALAAALPDAVTGGARVALRPGLVTALGRSLDAADLVFSLERAKSSGARPLLAAFGTPRRVPSDSLSIVIPGASPEQLAEALASPLTAIVPRDFTPAAPDGTGAFRATRAANGFVLDRNDAAARGPAFLARVEVRGSEGLASALRAFESGDADVGFLGAGLHRRRNLAVDFRAPSIGFVVLRTGPLAAAWAAPGIAERLVASMDRARFAHLGLSLLGPGAGDAAWGGAPCELFVDQGSPYLVEVANVVAAVLSRPGHEIRPSPLPLAELRRRRLDGSYALAVDVVRRLGPTPRHLLLSLLAAADPKLAERPPALPEIDVGVIGRMLPLAVLGDLGVTGARAAELRGLEQWDLGAIYREAPR